MLGEDGAVDAAWCSQIDVLDHYGLPKQDELQPSDEALLEGECGDVGLPRLIVEGFGYAGTLEGGKAFTGVLGK